MCCDGNVQAEQERQYYWTFKTGIMTENSQARGEVDCIMHKQWIHKIALS